MKRSVADQQPTPQFVKNGAGDGAVTFNEVEHCMPNKEFVSSFSDAGKEDRGTFMLEPRDESLLRKEKVI